MSTQLNIYNAPSPEYTVYRNWSCRPGDKKNEWKSPYLVEPSTVESVTNALKQGPFVALSKLGPRNYTDEPVRFDGQIPSHPSLPVHGWKVGAQRTTKAFEQPIIICGVQKIEGKEHIYYALAEDISEDPTKAIGTYRTTNDKIFVVSMKTFTSCETDMFPPATEEEIKECKNELVVPTPIAGKPDLIQAWQEGKISCKRLEDGSWQLTGVKPAAQSKIFVAVAGNDLRHVK